MAETADRTMTTPNGWDDTPLPKRNGPKGLLPSTWVDRSLRVEYTDAGGKAVTTTGVLLDWFPSGVVLNIGGARTLLCWERIALIELTES